MCLFFFRRDTATTVNVPYMTNNVKTCGGLVWTFCLPSFKAGCTFFCSKRWRLCLKPWWREPRMLPKRGYAVQQGVVFGVLSLKKGYTISSDPVILLEIVMLSPGTHLVKNHESLSRTIESQFKKQRALNWKSLGLYVNRQQTLYHSLLKLKRSPSI